jgi:hypothetical protein
MTDYKPFLAALAALETRRDGSGIIPGTNNPYNIKDFSGGGIAAFDKAEGSRDKYRVFANRDDADQHLLGLLSRKYPAALKATSAQEFATALKTGGYATDPKYVEKFVATANSLQGNGQTVDLSPFMGKYADQIAAAKQAGFTDQQILNNIRADEQSTSKNIATQGVLQELQAKNKPTISRDLTLQLAKHGDPERAVQALMNVPGYKEDVIWARQQQIPNEEILRGLVPDAMRGLDAYRKRAGSSFVENVGAGALDQGAGMVLGAQQLFSTGERNKQLLAEEAQRRVDPERIALENTVGGKVGSFAPDIALALATGGESLAGTAARRAATAAATAGLTGGLQPIVDGESRTANALTSAALSAAASGVIDAVPRVLRKAGDIKRSVLPSGDLVNDLNARAVSERVAQDVGHPLTGSHLDENWVKSAGEKLNTEFNTILDGSYASIPDDVMKKFTDPQFRNQLDSGYVDAIDSLLYNRVQGTKKIRQQLVDDAGNQLFEKYQVRALDADGKPIKETIVDAATGKKRTVQVMETRQRPKMGLVEVPTVKLEPRENLIPLREIHDLMKHSNNGLFQNAQGMVLDPYKRKALGELADSAKKVFDDGLTSGIPPDAGLTAEEIAAMTAGKKEALADVNRRYANYSVAKDVIVKTKGDANKLADAGIWDAVSSQKRYSDRFVRGESPLIDVQKAMKEHQLRVAEATARAKDSHAIGNIMLGVSGVLAPATLPLAYGFRSVLPKLRGRVSEPLSAAESLIGADKLATLKAAASANLPTNAERRLIDSGGTLRVGDNQNKVLKYLKRVRPVVDYSPEQNK